MKVIGVRGKREKRKEKNQQLYKGYERKSMTSRCLMKIDSKATYESLLSIFIEKVLHEFEFLPKVTQHVTTRVKTITCSLYFDGKSHGIFPKCNKSNLQQQ